ncbi:hypothetical protein J6590_053029, partial [Homalodisca vitripennis]
EVRDKVRRKVTTTPRLTRWIINNSLTFERLRVTLLPSGHGPETVGDQHMSTVVATFRLCLTYTRPTQQNHTSLQERAKATDSAAGLRRCRPSPPPPGTTTPAVDKHPCDRGGAIYLHQ